MNRNFIILFDEKEGSSPLVRALDNFDEIDVVHQVNKQGWEPFDPHNCGEISSKDYRRCLELIFNDQWDYIEELNHIYSKRATRALAPFDKRKSNGFKMRLRPQKRTRFRFHRKLLMRSIKRATFEILRAHHVVAFVLVRQDVFRLALSKYHGDGTGKAGHIQFRLASKTITRSEIPKIRVDCEEFERLVDQCERLVDGKKLLINEMGEYGIPAVPLLYEEFCNDKLGYFKDVLDILGIRISDKRISETLQQDMYFKKVHGTDISTFVINHEEVFSRFGHRFAEFDSLSAGLAKV